MLKSGTAGELWQPQVRLEGLLQRELPAGELMVYDTERHKAHSLNRTAALIWRHCDGNTNVGELVTLLRKLDLPADSDVVWLALSRLSKAHMLQEQPTRPPEGISRRQVMRKLGIVGGLSFLLPAITSIVAPTAARAESLALAGGCCQYEGSCSTTVTQAKCESGGGNWETTSHQCIHHQCTL
jgi:hypothetical protein